MNHAHEAVASGAFGPDAMLWTALLILLGAGYAGLRWRHPAAKSWEYRRSWCWYAGLLVAAVAVVGPVSGIARASFAGHMWGHLLLAMLAPILLVMAAPVTLVLRALSQEHGRRLAHLLASSPCRIVAHPVAASALHVGGLVALYRTPLVTTMHDAWWITMLVEGHMLAAGYLFTAAMIGIDPMRDRPGFRSRAVVLILALGAHASVAKSLYADPPAGVTIDAAEAASQVMYYGGDAVDLVLIVIFCWQWFTATAPREARRPARPHGETEAMAER